MTFSEFVKIDSTTTPLTYFETKNLITQFITDTEIQKLIYTLILLENDSGSGLKMYNNNLANIPATESILGGSNKQFIVDKQYICLEINNVSQPYFVFETMEKSIRLLNNRFGRLFKNEVVNFVDSTEYSVQFAKCYLKYFPYTTNIDYNAFKETNAIALKKLEDSIKKYFNTELKSL